MADYLYISATIKNEEKNINKEDKEEWIFQFLLKFSQ